MGVHDRLRTGAQGHMQLARPGFEQQHVACSLGPFCRHQPGPGKGGCKPFQRVLAQGVAGQGPHGAATGRQRQCNHADTIEAVLAIPAMQAERGSHQSDGSPGKLIGRVLHHAPIG